MKVGVEFLDKIFSSRREFREKLSGDTLTGVNELLDGISTFLARFA